MGLVLERRPIYPFHDVRFVWNGTACTVQGDTRGSGGGVTNLGNNVASQVGSRRERWETI